MGSREGSALRECVVAMPGRCGAPSTASRVFINKERSLVLSLKKFGKGNEAGGNVFFKPLDSKLPSCRPTWFPTYVTVRLCVEFSIWTTVSLLSPHLAYVCIPNTSPTAASTALALPPSAWRSECVPHLHEVMATLPGAIEGPFFHTCRKYKTKSNKYTQNHSFLAAWRLISA